MGYSLFLKKENFKFSSAHFTIFDHNSAEALHGHNYRVGIHLMGTEDTLENEMLCDFNIVKKIVRENCQALDEKVLVPTFSPFLSISAANDFNYHTHIQYGEKNYIFPDEDVLKIGTTNITSEALAFYLWKNIAEQLPPVFRKMTVTVEETRGQQASYTQNL